MTPKEILTRVHEEADVRIGDTVGRLMEILRNRHTHQCWTKECGCEYCRFINGEYVDAKLHLHRLKKKINYYDYLYNLTDMETRATVDLLIRQRAQVQRIWALKEHKRNLRTNVL